MLSRLIIGEIIFNCGLFIAYVYLVYLFFSKHYLLPKFYITILIIVPLIILLDTWLATSVVPDEPMFDSDTLKELIRSLIAGLIWIPYMLVSKRVKLTFIEKIDRHP